MQLEVKIILLSWDNKAHFRLITVYLTSRKEEISVELRRSFNTRKCGSSQSYYTVWIIIMNHDTVDVSIIESWVKSRWDANTDLDLTYVSCLVSVLGDLWWLAYVCLICPTRAISACVRPRFEAQSDALINNGSARSDIYFSNQLLQMSRCYLCTLARHSYHYK